MEWTLQITRRKEANLIKTTKEHLTQLVVLIGLQLLRFKNNLLLTKLVFTDDGDVRDVTDSPFDPPQLLPQEEERSINNFSAGFVSGICKCLIRCDHCRDLK